MDIEGLQQGVRFGPVKRLIDHVHIPVVVAGGPENYGKALQAVIANQGAPGIDGMKTEELNGHLLKHWPKIQAKLLAGTYTPSPVRRVEIPKPNGGKRRLGVPTVLDRFIQQMLLLAMTPIWEPRFSEHSYGFRPGRKAADAVRAAQGYARTGKDWVVDLSFFHFAEKFSANIFIRYYHKVEFSIF